MNRRNVIKIDEKRSKLFSSIVTVMLLLSSFFIILVVTTPVVLADVSSIDVIINPPTAGFENATYSITFSVNETGNLTEINDWINITFPDGTSVNQTTLVAGTVSNGTSTKAIEANFTMYNNNLTINIILPVNISDSGQVWINLTQGIMNPTVAGSYNLSINTTKEPTLVKSDVYTITFGDVNTVEIVANGSTTLNPYIPLDFFVWVNDSFNNVITSDPSNASLIWVNATNGVFSENVGVYDVNVSYLGVDSDVITVTVINTSIKALKWDGDSTAYDTIVYYHYYNNGNNIQFLVENVSSSGVDNVTANFSAFGLSESVEASKLNDTTWKFDITWGDGNGTDVDSEVHIINVSMNLTIGGPQPIGVFVLVNINPLDLVNELGGATTNWSSVSNTTDFSNITNLVFEIENLGKLTLEGPINLCDNTTAVALAELGSYLTIAQATMSLNTTALAAFNCNSSLMMYYLDFQELPSIYYIPDVGEPQLVVNAGDLVTGQTKITDDINWDGTNLTFNVSGWSQYQAFDSAPTVTVNPSTVGVENATYSITFSVNNTGNLTENIDWINITFPNGTSVNQTAMVNGTVSNGTSELYIDSFTMLNNNLTLNITVPVNISDNGQVWINITKGIKNPIIPGLYNISINTSKQTSSVISTDYSIVPAAPTGFTATAASTSQINLAWTKGLGADYTIIRGKTEGYPTSPTDGTNVSNSAQTSCSSTGLSAGTTYYYSAWSWNSTSNLWSSTYTSASAKTQTGSSPPPPSPPPSAPTAIHGGPYTGTAGTPVQFNGSESTATSGRTITSYSWTFGDGSTGTGATPTHTYTTAGTYTVTLTVTDSQGSTGSASTTATITAPPGPPKEEVSEEVMNQIQEDYNITLEEPFYATDTNDDGVFDTFTDPNGVLTNVNNVKINNQSAFLISTNEDNIPEFFWNTETGDITSITYAPAQTTTEETDKVKQTITLEITVEKADWIYIDVSDQYPTYELTVKTSDGRTISSDMIWRENGKIYILDDPDTIYVFTYNYTILPPIFSPAAGTKFDVSKPTITITYDEQVIITSALLNNNDILQQISTTDYMTFTFTPASNLQDGQYLMSITAQDETGNTLTSTSSFTIQSEKPITTPDEEFPTLLVAIILIIVIVLLIIGMLFKKGYIYIERESEEEQKKKK